jgi:hypothetical protein
MVCQPQGNHLWLQERLEEFRFSIV